MSTAWSYPTTMGFGAIAGMTIFLGLPVARLTLRTQRLQGFLNALATGVLLFLLWDVLTGANEPVENALNSAHAGDFSSFATLLAMFLGGLAVGLLSLVYLNRYLASRLREAKLRNQTAATGAPTIGADTGRALALMIAIGLGAHNLSEGLAIGQAAATGAITFATVLVLGFGLHNLTEGFGIAAPMTSDAQRPSWVFLALAGTIGGAPTFIGTMIGFNFRAEIVFVLFLTLAAGALIYVINEMFSVGRRLNSPVAMAWGLTLGFAAAYSTDLLLLYLGG